MEPVEQQLRSVMRPCCRWSVVCLTSAPDGNGTSIHSATSECVRHHRQSLFVKTFTGRHLQRGRVQARASVAVGDALETGFLLTSTAADGSALRIYQRDVSAGRVNLAAVPVTSARLEATRDFFQMLARTHRLTDTSSPTSLRHDQSVTPDHRVVDFAHPGRAREAAFARENLTRWLQRDGTGVPPAWAANIHTALQRWPELAGRRAQQGSLSVVHGDVSPANVFVASTGALRPALIDWECASVAPGPFDLSYFLALNYRPTERRELEPDVLAAYADARYDGEVGRHDRVLHDYQLGLVGALFVAFAWKRWEPLYRVGTALDDWNAWPQSA